ncbi:LexA family protein [Patescibacteria group bacterium]
MHPIQKAILGLAEQYNLATMRLEDIGLIATGKLQARQKIKYHLDQLIDSGHLIKDEETEDISRAKKGDPNGAFIAVPILGEANAGPATIFADEVPKGFLHLSRKYGGKNPEGLFVVEVVGSSMNLAEINGKRIEDGDLVLIDSKDIIPKDRDYVLSVIGGLANVKEYREDRENNQIVLVSRSTEEITPIFIHPEEDSDYVINGKVVDVFKKPSV